MHSTGRLGFPTWDFYKALASRLETSPKILKVITCHSRIFELFAVYTMTGDPEFVMLKYQAWLNTTKFENKILGSIVKEFLSPTNNYVPGM